MLEQYTDDPTTYDPYQQFQKLEPPQTLSRRDSLLETCTRYGAFFSLGVLLTLVVRLFPQLQPLFWMGAIVALIGLGFAVHMTRRVELLAIALIVAAALVAGHWDWFTYGLTDAAHQPTAPVTSPAPVDPVTSEVISQ